MSKAKKIVATAAAIEGDKTLVDRFAGARKEPQALSFSPGAGGGFAMTPILRAGPK